MPLPAPTRLQCSLEGLLHAGGEGEAVLDAAEGDHAASSSCAPSAADANADLIARLSACLDDDDPPPPLSSTSPASLPAAPAVPLPLSVQPPVSALEPFPAPLTPAQLQTSSKIFSSWKDFSPNRMRSVVIPHQVTVIHGKSAAIDELMQLAGHRRLHVRGTREHVEER